MDKVKRHYVFPNYSYLKNNPVMTTEVKNKHLRNEIKDISSIPLKWYRFEIF